MPKPSEAPDIARLRLQDDEEDIFASPQNHTSNTDDPSATKPARSENRHDAQEARDARLQAELERMRESYEHVSAAFHEPLPSSPSHPSYPPPR